MVMGGGKARMRRSRLQRISKDGAAVLVASFSLVTTTTNAQLPPQNNTKPTVPWTILIELHHGRGDASYAS